MTRWSRRDWLVGGAGLLSAAVAPGRARADVVKHVTYAQCHFTLEVGRQPPVPVGTLASWVERAAAMVVDYFGAFPVPDLKVEIVTGGFGALGWGQHFRGRRLEIHAGRRTDKADIRRDWVMVHEMMHCAYPWLDRRHRWMREGLSTYLESIVRAEAQVIGADDVWARWLDKMPHGVPRGEGFDDDGSWGATYWGGALFWLLCDLEIRRRTQGAKTLRDGLRTILKTLGSSRRARPIAKVMATGDNATGTTVFTDFYAAYGRRGDAIDLDALWRRLGVANRRGQVVFDDGAPEAALRKSLTAPRHRLPPLR